MCAAFRRSFYLRFAGERYACVGDASLGRGPLNALVAGFRQAGDRRADLRFRELGAGNPPAAFRASDSVSLGAARPCPTKAWAAFSSASTTRSRRMRSPRSRRSTSGCGTASAMPAEAESLIGLGPGLTPSGDDYLGGMMVALHGLARAEQARTLWRWLQPRLAGAHQRHQRGAPGRRRGGRRPRSAARGPAGSLAGIVLAALDAVGHCSGWDALAGAAAVLRG